MPAVGASDGGDVGVVVAGGQPVEDLGADRAARVPAVSGIDRAGLLSKEGMADASDEVLRRAADLGAQAAAITVSRAGANPPWSDEL